MRNVQLWKLFWKLLSLLACFVLRCHCQFVIRQSDRMQIMQATFTSTGQQTLTFPTAFLNTPLITYSILQNYIGIDGAVGIQISTVTATPSSVTLSLSMGSGNTLYSVVVGVLATDYPNQVQYSGSFSSKGSQTFTAPSNIIGYCAYVKGFLGNRAFAELQFKFTSSVALNNITIEYAFTQILNMSSISFNVLVFYSQTSQTPTAALLYQFVFTTTNEMSLNSFETSKNFSINTNLPNSDKAFFGFSYWQTFSYLKYNFFVNSSTPMINNAKINLILNNSNGHIDFATISIFQLLIRYCPSGRFIIYTNSDYVCTNDCTSINSQTYNDNLNLFPMDYNTYQMNPCSSCHSSCYGCSGPNSNQCTSCHSGQYLDATSKSCSLTQLPQSYCSTKSIDSFSYYYCFQCYSSCNTCSGSANNECTSCLSTYPYSYKGQCISVPMDGMYCDSITLICSDCLQSNCIKCDSTLTNCLQCAAGLYRFIF